jgi:hypothetical protein
MPNACRIARSQPPLGRERGRERQGLSVLSSCCKGKERSMALSE